MTEIYAVRHGKTVWNQETKMQGKLNSPLTDEGINGAIDLRPQIRGKDITEVLVSPMPRALQTAYLATEGKLPIKVEPLLREMDLGIWEGVRAAEAYEEYPAEYDRFKSEAHLYTPIDGGETFFEVDERVRELIKKLTEREDNGPILLVTHQILVQTLLTILEGRDVSTLRKTAVVEQTKLFRFMIDKPDESGMTKAVILMRNGIPAKEEYFFKL